MRLYPAIDMKNGQCVRLTQGLFDNVNVYSDSLCRYGGSLGILRSPLPSSGGSGRRTGRSLGKCPRHTGNHRACEDPGTARRRYPHS